MLPFALKNQKSPQEEVAVELRSVSQKCVSELLAKRVFCPTAFFFQSGLFHVNDQKKILQIHKDKRIEKIWLKKWSQSPKR